MSKQQDLPRIPLPKGWPKRARLAGTLLKEVFDADSPVPGPICLKESEEWRSLQESEKSTLAGLKKRTHQSGGLVRRLRPEPRTR